jgi:hypothetical protein
MNTLGVRLLLILKYRNSLHFSIFIIYTRMQARDRAIHFQFQIVHNMQFANSLMCVMVCRNKQSRSDLMVQFNLNYRVGEEY